MRMLFLSFVFCLTSAFSIELAPTNFDLRSLTILISQECQKNIVVSSDVKNLSADYFFISDVDPDIIFSSFKKLIEAKGLFLNDYNDFFMVEAKPFTVADKKNYSNIELSMKIVEVNTDLFNERGLASLLSANTSLKLSSLDLKKFTVDKLFEAEFTGLLNALETNGYLKIVSEPKIVVANGKSSVMNVGDTISVKTSAVSSDTALGASSTVRNTYIQKELGLTIKVTPTIHSNGQIFLNTSLTHEILKKQDDDGLISTNKKSINSDFYILDGGSIILGGLTSAQIVKDISKIPVLGDIPVLDYFFSHEADKKLHSSLSILIEVKVLK